MKYHALFVIFEKKRDRILNCRLLQIIGGALRVRFGLSIHLRLYLACASSEGQDESVHLHMLV